jgi:hypothetical protein
MAIKFKAVKAEVTATTPKAQKALQQLQAKAETTLEGELKVKLAPTKVKQKTAAEALAEELIVLHQQLVATDGFAMFKRYEELKKQLQSIANDSGAPKDKPFVFSTDIGSVIFKECRTETTITDKQFILKQLGMDTFLNVAKVNLTDAKKYLSDNELAQCTEKGFGSRVLQSVAYKAL